MNTSKNIDISISQIVSQFAREEKIPFWYEKETTSTNNIAKESQFFGKNSYLFITDHQTLGRGRGTNQWKDQPGDQLLSTWSIYTQTPPQPPLTIAIGLILFEALHEAWPSQGWSLKAPNDILFNEKKVAGLLVEVVSQIGYQVIVGLGLNVLSSPPNLDQPTMSLLEIHQQSYLNSEDSKNSISHQFEKSLLLFLNKFWKDLNSLLNSNLIHLSSDMNSRIIEALNRNKLLTEPYLEISKEGTLRTATQTLEWSQL